MIQTSDLKFSYQTQQAPFAFPDLDIAPGQHHLLLGPSGCGKTTLLHLIGGLLRPTQGHILLDGQDLGQLSEKQLDALRGKKIGIVFQQSYLLKSLNVLDNLLAARFFANLSQDRQRALNLLQSLQIEHKAQSRIADLSLGEQQRVAIARALMNSPKLLLADEPTSSLDDHNCQEVLRLLLEQSEQQGSTLLIVTHDARLKSAFERKVILG